jgi:hypothetical protein
VCGELLRWHGEAALARYLPLKAAPEALARIFHTPCDEIGGNAVEIVIELALMP